MTLIAHPLPHHLEPILDKSAPGPDMTKAGRRKAGVTGMTAVIVVREKNIIIILGGILLAHRNINHVHHHHSTLQLKLYRSHQHHRWQRLVYGGLPPVAGGLKGKAL